MRKAKIISIKEKKMDKNELMLSILNPIMLYIGRWKFKAINEKDNELVVKLSFVNKQICYEVLLKDFREKIEIEWSNIMGIRASFNHNEPGILELELSQPPKLYEKLNNVDHRAHRKWIVGLDFTQGQAPICRRHLIMFPPGMLDKHYERLISFDKHLFELSQKPYPTINISYFHKQPNVFQSNQFTMTNSDNQILQVPHVADHFAPTSGVGLPSNSMLLESTFGTVTMNNNSKPQECSNWRSVLPQVGNTISNSNGYIWNNNNNIGGISNNNNNNNNNGCNLRNMPIMMYSDGIWNNNEAMIMNPNNGLSSLHDSLEASNGYFTNWPTDEYGVWLPPPQQHMPPN